MLAMDGFVASKRPVELVQQLFSTLSSKDRPAATRSHDNFGMGAAREDEGEKFAIIAASARSAGGSAHSNEH